MTRDEPSLLITERFPARRIDSPRRVYTAVTATRRTSSRTRTTANADHALLATPLGTTTLNAIALRSHTGLGALALIVLSLSILGKCARPWAKNTGRLREPQSNDPWNTSGNLAPPWRTMKPALLTSLDFHRNRKLSIRNSRPPWSGSRRSRHANLEPHQGMREGERRRGQANIFPVARRRETPSPPRVQTSCCRQLSPKCFHQMAGIGI